MTAAALLAGCSLFGGDDAVSTTADEPATLPSVAWNPAAYDEVRDGGTLRLAVQALPANFNPEHVANAQSEVRRLLAPTRGSAISITADGGWEVDDRYARSVEVVGEDPLQVEVVLNPDAVWQDGEPITARDARSWIRALRNDDFPSTGGAGADNVASVEKGDDDFTYTVTFDSPTVDWPRYVYPTLPARITEDRKRFDEALENSAPASNGPFVVTEIDRETGRVVMERNPQWWDTPPRLERITWQAATPDVQLAAMATDELDLIDVQSSEFPAAADADLDGAALQVSAGTQWTHLTMNGGRGPLRDVEVRRAVAAALDRRAIADQASVALDAPATVMDSFLFVPGQPGAEAGEPLERDLERARALLDEAGWVAEGDAVRERDGEPLELVLPVGQETTTSLERAQVIADQLAEVGIAVQLDPVPDDRWFDERIRPLDFDLVTFSYLGSPFPVVDAEGLYHPVDSPRNITGLDDDDLGDRFAAAIGTIDGSAAAGVDERLFELVPLVPLGVVPEVRAVRDDLRNIGASQFLQPDWIRVGFVAE